MMLKSLASVPLDIAWNCLMICRKRKRFIFRLIGLYHSALPEPAGRRSWAWRWSSRRWRPYPAAPDWTSPTRHSGRLSGKGWPAWPRTARTGYRGRRCSSRPEARRSPHTLKIKGGLTTRFDPPPNGLRELKLHRLSTNVCTKTKMFLKIFFDIRFRSEGA